MINKSFLALTRTLSTVGSRNVLMQGRYMLPSLHLEHEGSITLYHAPKRGLFSRKKPEEQEQKQKEKETTEKKQESGNSEKEDKNSKTQDKATNDAKDQKKSTKEENASTNSEEDLQQPKPQNLSKLLSEKPEGFEGEIRHLFRKQEQELALKTKTVDDLVQKLKAEEQATQEWHKKIDSLRKSVKEAEEDAALTRKRYEKMMEESKIYSISKFAKDILEIPDNLERAVEAVKDPAIKETELYHGVTATHSILLNVLERHNVTKLNPLKEKFDPNKHEALFDYDDPKAEPGTCGVVAQPGYLIHDRVLRPAKVGVVKKRS